MNTNTVLIGFNMSGGWTVLNYLQQLFSSLLDCQLIVLPSGLAPRSKVLRLIDLALDRRREACGDFGIFLAPSPASMTSLHCIPDWRKRFRYLAAYVLDSWYINWYSREARLFDVLFVSRLEDVDVVKRRTRRPVYYLPFGADVIRARQGINFGIKRDVDLLIYGRQPAKIMSCNLTDQAPELNVNLNVPFDSDPVKNQDNIFSAAGHAKAALAFCNTVQYHADLPPVSPFITFRWLDNLAAGAKMVGKIPRPVGYEDVIGWSDAYYDIPPEHNRPFSAIRDHLHSYNHRIGIGNHYQSLIRNDWRLRLRDLYSQSQIPLPNRLAIELLNHKTYAQELERKMNSELIGNLHAV